jgi:hypothetical protein
MNDSTIANAFNKYGSEYALVKREGRVALYSTSRDGKPTGHEIMVVQSRKSSMLKGREITAGDALPSASAWGIFGWTFGLSQEAACSDRFARTCKHFNPRVVRKLRRVGGLKR